MLPTRWRTSTWMKALVTAVTTSGSRTPRNASARSDTSAGTSSGLIANETRRPPATCGDRRLRSVQTNTVTPRIA